MVKFIAKHPVKGNILGLGISEENVYRLKQGQPILIKSEDLKELGLNWQGEIVLFYGKTEEDMQKDVIDKFERTK